MILYDLYNELASYYKVRRQLDILIQHWRRDDGLQKRSFQVTDILNGGQLSLGADARRRTTG